MPHLISIANQNTQFLCQEQHSLLSGLEGQKIKAVQVGCRGGGCGVCKIRILDGNYQSKKMSIKHVSADELAAGVALSCRIFPLSEMTVETLD